MFRVVNINNCDVLFEGTEEECRSYLNGIIFDEIECDYLDTELSVVDEEFYQSM